MKTIRFNKENIDMELSIEELTILRNALKQVCAELYDFDMKARIEISREEANVIVESLSQLINQNN